MDIFWNHTFRNTATRRHSKIKQNRSTTKQEFSREAFSKQNINRRLTNLLSCSPSDDRVVRHICIRCISLKLISSPYCAVSEPYVYKHYKWRTRWNANRCYSLRTTYLIFETFQILFPTASMIFTAVKLFHEVILEERSIKLRLFRIHNGGCF